MTASLTSHDICARAPVIPVLIVEDRAHAAPMAEALVRGGLPVLEVTLRTPIALDVICDMIAAAPDAIVGAGTLLTPEDVAAAKAAGAAFGVSPGSTPRLLDAARDHDMPILPGAGTPSEIMALLERGIDMMKFFPAEQSGGAAMLKALSSPLPAARFCPTGGVSPLNKADYLGLPNVVCVGGSWVTPKDAIAAGDWARVEALAREAAK